MFIRQLQSYFNNCLLGLNKKRNQYKLLSNVINNSPDGICVVNKQGKIIFASPKATELFAYETKEEMLGLNIKQLMSDESYKIGQSNIAKIYNGEKSFGFVYQLIRKDSSVFYGEINSSYIEKNGVVGPHNGAKPREVLIKI